MKKIISLMLVFIMMFTFTSTSLATIGDRPSNSIDKHSDVSEQSNGPKISKVDNAEYYMDYTDEYNITIGKLSNGNLDISYYDKVNDVLYHSFSENKYTKSDVKEFYTRIKNDILNQEMKLEAIDQGAFTSRVTLNSSAHSDAIWNLLQDLGWKSPGTSLVMTETRNGDYGKIDLATGYSYRDRINIFTGVLGTSVGLVATLLGIDVSTALKIGIFTYSVAQGVYVLLFDQNFSEYNVYAYEDKFVYINNGYQYRAGRTVKWVAACGDAGATLTFKSNRYDNDFYDNNSLMDTGFYNYYNY